MTRFYWKMVFVSKSLFLALIVSFIGLNGCQNKPERGRSEVMESFVLSKIANAKSEKKKRIDISEMPEFTPGRICFQGPYINSEQFHKATGISSLTFESLNDDSIYVWWILDDKGNSAWIKVPRVKVADKDSNFRKPCVNLKKEILVIDCDESCTYAGKKI